MYIKGRLEFQITMSYEFLLILYYKRCETSIYNGNRKKLLIWALISTCTCSIIRWKYASPKNSLSDSKHGDQKKIGLVFGNIMFVVMLLPSGKPCPSHT
jgi:hypothetical protein